MTNTNDNISCKSQLLTKHGDYDSYSFENINLRDIKKNEVLVKVLYCSINNTDIWTREGLYSSSEDSDSGWQPLQFPVIQGADIVGIIENANDNSLIGSKVIVYPVINEEESSDDIKNITECKYLGSEVNGGYSQYCIVPENNIFIIPESCNLSLEELACIPTAYMTAYYMIKRVEPKQSDKCIITGASGGVGYALIQLLKLMDIETIGICGKNKEDILINDGLTKAVIRDNKLP